MDGIADVDLILEDLSTTALSNTFKAGYIDKSEYHWDFTSYQPSTPWEKREFMFPNKHWVDWAGDATRAEPRNVKIGVPHSGDLSRVPVVSTNMGLVFNKWGYSKGPPVVRNYQFIQTYLTSELTGGPADISNFIPYRDFTWSVEFMPFASYHELFFII